MRLHITDERQERLEFECSGSELVIGRSPTCDVIVDRPHVSGRHLKLVHGVVVEDLGSTNGTFLDGARVEAPTAINGQRLTMGGLGLTVEVHLERDAALGPVVEAMARMRERVRELEGKLTRNTGRPEELIAVSAVRAERRSRVLSDLVEDQEEVERDKDPEPETGRVTDLILFELFHFIRALEEREARSSASVARPASGELRDILRRMMNKHGAADAREEFATYLGSLLPPDSHVDFDSLATRVQPD